MTDLQKRTARLTEIQTSERYYNSSFTITMAKLPLQPRKASKYQFEHAEGIIEEVLNHGCRLSETTCEGIAVYYADEDITAASLAYMSQHISKMFYPEKYPGQIPTDRFQWLEDFTVAYCRHYHPSVKITLDAPDAEYIAV